MVVISSYPSMPDAAIVKGMLGSHGIESVLKDRNNLYVPVFGGVDLLVNESDYDRARRLLDEHKDV